MRSAPTLMPPAALLLAICVASSYGQAIQSDSDRLQCSLNWDVGVTHKWPLPVFSDDETMVASELRQLDAFTYVDWRVMVLEVPTCNLIRDVYVSSRDAIRSIAFSPDNRHIAVARGGRIGVYDVQSGNDDPVLDVRHRLLTDPLPYYLLERHVQFSHDGTKIFFHAKPHNQYGPIPDVSFGTFPISDWKNFTEVQYNDFGVHSPCAQLE